MEKFVKIKLIIDKKLLNNEIKEKELNYLKTGADIYYLSINECNDIDTIYIKENDLINNISSFMIKLAIMTKNKNMDDILFISDNKGLLSLLGNLNFKTLLIYNPKFDCVEYEPTCEISNGKQLIKVLGGNYENSITKRK